MLLADKNDAWGTFPMSAIWKESVCALEWQSEHVEVPLLLSIVFYNAEEACFQVVANSDRASNRTKSR